MMDRDQDAIFDRLLAPYALFLGLALSFGLCCASGLGLRQHNCFENFVRFHDYIHPVTNFYPTASQVRALARSEIAPDKIAVIVGGSSVLYGDGQGSDLWTTRLQELLGDRYKVMNFGMRGAWCGEFGAVAAEILSSDYQRLIFITQTWPGTGAGPAIPDGRGPWQKFYWDAHYKGLLTHDSAREDRLRELSAERKGDNQFAELQREMQLDHCLHFHQLWTTLAYTHVSTVWNPCVRSSILKPRRAYRDPKVPFPAEQRYPSSHTAVAIKGIRATIQGNSAAHSTLFFEQTFNLAFPAPFRQRTVIIVNPHSPYYVNQLESAEQASYAALSPATVQLLEKIGFTGVDMGSHLSSVEDFVDQVHLSEEGGRKLADEVAPKVRELAQRLGYLKQGESR